MNAKEAFEAAAKSSKRGPHVAVYSKDTKSWHVNTLACLREMNDIQGYEFDWKTAVTFSGGKRVEVRKVA